MRRHAFIDIENNTHTIIDLDDIITGMGGLRKSICLEWIGRRLLHRVFLRVTVNHFTTENSIRLMHLEYDRLGNEFMLTLI